MSLGRFDVRCARRTTWLAGAVALACALLCALLVMPAGAGAASVATPISVRLSTSSKGLLSLRIRRGTRTVFNGLVSSKVCGNECTPTAVPPGHGSLHALELGGTQPAVLLGLYSGGAHCCFSDQLYVVNPTTDKVRRSEIDLLDDQPTLVKLGHEYALRGADARIAEEYFTDFAHSGAPFAEWSLTPRGFVSVTRSFKGAIVADASRWWKRFERNQANGVGYIAAWAADEDNLGHTTLVAHTLAQLARQNRLNSSLAGPGYGGTAFVRALQKALRSLGYTRR